MQENKLQEHSEDGGHHREWPYKGFGAHVCIGLVVAYLIVALVVVVMRAM